MTVNLYFNTVDTNFTMGMYGLIHPRDGLMMGDGGGVQLSIVPVIITIVNINVLRNFKVFWIFDDHSRLRKGGNQCSNCNFCSKIIPQAALSSKLQNDPFGLYTRVVI